MSDAQVDELFSEGAGSPTVARKQVLSLLVPGLILAFLGLSCVTAPGGVLVLLAWLRVEKEADRVSSGYLPESARAEVETLRFVTYGGLLVVVTLIMLQAILLCAGFYDAPLEAMIPYWRAAIEAILRALGATPISIEPPA